MSFTCAGHLPSPKPYLISAYWPGEPPADARNAAVFGPKSPCVTAPTFGFSRAIFSLCIWRQSKAHLAARTWWKWICRQVEVVSCVPERIPWVLQPSALGLGDHARGFLLPCGVRRKLIHICTWQLLGSQISLRIRDEGVQKDQQKNHFGILLYHQYQNHH